MSEAAVVDATADTQVATTDTATQTGVDTATVDTAAQDTTTDTATTTDADTATSDATADWRTQLAGGDEKRLKALERFSDPAAYDKAFRDTQAALRDSGRIKLPGEDATPEEMAEFNKTLGVPESPDGYEISVEPPEGLEVGEADKAVLQGVVAKLHGMGGMAATPQMANFAHEVYYGMMEEQASQMAAQAAVAKQATETNLKNDWGPEYKINMGYANSAIQSYFNVENAQEVLDWVGADGTKLGDNEAFVRAMTSAGRATSEDPNFLQALTGEGLKGDALQTEIDKIKGWRRGTPAEQKQYAEASQRGGRLEQLMARQQKVSSRAA